MTQITKEVILLAKKEALNEIQKYGSPPLTLFEISEKYAKLLADKYNANIDIVLLGSYLADYKLGQALQENRIQDHIKMSSTAAIKLLTKLGLQNSEIKKVIHCINAHHGDIPYESIEAEVVANADCYRFLTLRGVVAFINNLSHRKDQNIDSIIRYVEDKANEKWNIISLKEVKGELKENYKEIQNLVKKTKSV